MAQETHHGCRVAKAEFPDGEKVFSPRPHEVTDVSTLPDAFWWGNASGVNAWTTLRNQHIPQVLLFQPASARARAPQYAPSLADNRRVSCLQALYQLAVVRKGAGDFVIAEGLLRTCAGVALPTPTRHLQHSPWTMSS